MERILENIEIQIENIDKSLSKNGEMNLDFKSKGKSYQYHSKYNPSRESSKLIDSIEWEYVELTIFLGFGVGYNVKEYLEKVEPVKPFIIIALAEEEIDEENPIYRHATNHDYFRGVFLLDKEEDKRTLYGFILEWSSQSTQVVPLPMIKKFQEEIYSEFVDDIAFIKRLRAINKRAFYEFDEIGVNNSFRSYALSHRHLSLEEGVFPYIKGKDVMVVAAGPSLNREIDRLKKIKKEKKAFIFAVGSAALTLINNDLLPDAVYMFDGREENYNNVARHIIEKGYDTKMPLFYGTNVSGLTLKNYKGPKYYFITLQDVAADYYRLRNEARHFGGSSIAVGGIATMLAAEVKRLFLVGQNLAMIDNQSYAKDIDHMDDNLNNRIIKTAFDVELVDGTIGKTVEIFYIFREQIECLIESYDAKNVINTTYRGAKIKGTEYVPLEELMDDIMKNDPIDTNFKSKDENIDITKEPLYKKYVEKKEALKEDQYKFAKFNKKIIENLEHLNRYYDKDDEYHMEKLLRKFDKMALDAEKNNYYKYVLKMKHKSMLSLLRDHTVDIEVLPVKSKVELALTYYLPYFQELKKYKDDLWDHIEIGENNFSEK